MRFVILAFLVTVSRLAVADTVDPKCVNSLEDKPLCLSKLNSQMYCARMVGEPHAAQLAKDCYDRLKYQSLTLSELQSICIGGLTEGDTDDLNQSLCN